MRQSLYKGYDCVKMCEEDSFTNDVIEIGEKLLNNIGESRRSKWIKTKENLDVLKNSQKAWILLKHLNNE